VSVTLFASVNINLTDFVINNSFIVHIFHLIDIVVIPGLCIPNWLVRQLATGRNPRKLVIPAKK